MQKRAFKWCLGIAVGVAILIAIANKGGNSSDGQVPDGGSGYVSDAPLLKPSIDVTVRDGALTDCTPERGTIVVTVTKLSPSAVYNIQMGPFGDEADAPTKGLDPGIDGRAVRTFDCASLDKGHYGIRVVGGGHTVTAAFDVYSALS